MQVMANRQKASPLLKAARHWQIYAMMLPGLLLILLFHYLPMLGLVMCFNDFNPILGVQGFWQSEWVGLKWFEKFINSFYFERIMRNTLLINIAKLLCGFWVPIVFALLLNEERNRIVKKTVQTVSYMPYFISWVVTIALMDSLFSPTSGLVNNIRNSMALPSIYFMGKEEYFYPMIIGSSIWKGFGWSSIIYIAALAGVDAQLHEAAQIDGASRVQRIWHVDFPHIKPTIMILLIMGIGNIMSVGFEKAYLMQNNLNLQHSELISTYVYRIGLSGEGRTDFSYATAIGLFNSVINLVLILGANTLSRKLSQTSLF